MALETNIDGHSLYAAGYRAVDPNTSFALEIAQAAQEDQEAYDEALAESTYYETLAYMDSYHDGFIYN